MLQTWNTQSIRKLYLSQSHYFRASYCPIFCSLIDVLLLYTVFYKLITSRFRSLSKVIFGKKRLFKVFLLCQQRLVITTCMFQRRQQLPATGNAWSPTVVRFVWWNTRCMWWCYWCLLIGDRCIGATLQSALTSFLIHLSVIRREVSLSTGHELTNFKV